VRTLSTRIYLPISIDKQTLKVVCATTSQEEWKIRFAMPITVRLDTILHDHAAFLNTQSANVRRTLVNLVLEICDIEL
jgi:hypothetical protein